MPRTPDDTPGDRLEEATVYDPTNLATSPGEVRYDGARFSMRDAAGEFDPRGGGGGSGITASQHRALDQLPHGIAEPSYDEYVYTGNRVTSIITWTDSGKTTKIREEQYVYSGNQISTITTIQYDAAGVVAVGETMVETFSFTGSKVDDVDRAVS